MNRHSTVASHQNHRNMEYIIQIACTINDHPMKLSSIFLRISLLSALFPFFLSSQAQEITTIQAGGHSDSSYYDIARIDANEFWVGGENGILTCLDTLGNISHLRLPVKDRDILKIVPAGNYVYVATDQGTIFRYNRARDTWIYSDYSDQGFGKLTFYDMVVMKNGTVVLSGGHNKIAQGKVSVPRGFVATIDEELLGTPSIVWSHALMFAFTLEYDEAQHEVYFAAFNGVNSQLFSSVDGAHTFQRKSTIPGLVHHLQLHEGEMWYAGAKTFRYSRIGIAGKVGEKPLEMAGEGCVWSLMPLEDDMYCLAFNGAIVAPTQDFDAYSFKIRPSMTSLYEAAPISATKAFIIGHGRTILLIEKDQQQEGVSLRYGR